MPDDDDFLRRFPPEVMRLVELSSSVLDDEGDEGDLVARLVADVGEAEALRQLAFVQLLSARTSRAKVATQQAWESLPALAEGRRCPTCGSLCENCLDEWDDEMQTAMGD